MSSLPLTPITPASLTLTPNVPKLIRNVVRLDDPHVGGSPTPLGSTATDALAFFNAAIVYAQSLFSGGGEIFVPAGQWFISGQILLPDGFKLTGESSSSARIRAMDSFSGASMIANKANSQEYVWCDDLYVDGRGVAPIGILYDTVFVNSGIRRCVCTNFTTNAVKIQTTVIGGGSGPVSVTDVWGVSAGQDTFLLSGSLQVWMRNITAERPGAGYACINMTCTSSSQGEGVIVDGAHLETSNASCVGVLIDGFWNVHLRNISAGFPGGTFSDIVKIVSTSGTPENVTVDGVFTSSTSPNGINDTVNGVSVTGKKLYPRYVMPEAAAVRATVSVGSSPFTYQNLDGRPLILVISGGTVSAVAYSRDNSTFDTAGSATGCVVPVAPGDYVKVTYSGTPTIAKYPVTW